MPNALTAAGLETATRQELVDNFTASMQAIYGSDINLDSDSPDGQMMNIFIQAVLDLQDLLVQIYNSFDPDNAIGNVLDQRVAINGIQRQAGTYTITPITVVNSQSVNLYGLDQTDQEVYTVADNAGNQWKLIDTQLGLAAGTHVLNFRAATPGANLTVPNTITVPVTIVLGVTSINNPTTYTTLGLNEESDAVLKVRRQQSVALSSQGYLAGLLAALENINGITTAFIYENTGSTTDGDGVPGHSIWVIVAGTAAAADIAQAIYSKRNAGCGMFGDQSYTLTQIDNTPFTLYWDEVEVQNIFIAFTVAPIDGVTTVNLEAIRSGLVTALTPGVHATVDVNEVATKVQAIDPNCLVTNAGLSNGKTQTLTLSGIAASGTFKVNYNGVASAAINWNDSIATIQSTVQAVTGLSTVTVTGSIASQSLVFDLSGITDVLSLLTVTNNSLLTGGSVAITFSYNENNQNYLTPTAKKNQFAVAEANIYILPMQMSPASAAVVVTTGTATFTGLGGYGSYTYSLSVNASGGSINATTGVYTAGGSTGVDTVKATDAFGNYATANVTVS